MAKATEAERIATLQDYAPCFVCGLPSNDRGMARVASIDGKGFFVCCEHFLRWYQCVLAMRFYGAPN